MGTRVPKFRYYRTWVHVLTSTAVYLFWCWSLTCTLLLYPGTNIQWIQTLSLWGHVLNIYLINYVLNAGYLVVLCIHLLNLLKIPAFRRGSTFSSFAIFTWHGDRTRVCCVDPLKLNRFGYFANLFRSIFSLWPESIYFGGRIYLCWKPVPIIGWNPESISIYFMGFQYIY